ncbi:MAG: amidohydrolase family protein, partial [Acidimicrobiales bacterium]
TDYPHLDSTWPDSRQCAEDLTAGLTTDQCYKFLGGHAIKMLRMAGDGVGTTGPTTVPPAQGAPGAP